MATKEILSLPLTNGDKGVFLARKSAGIYRANMSTSSSATDFKVTADDITELYDGLTIVCKNSVIASAENCTINLNNLGAKRIWLSQSNSYCTTHWAVNQAYIFIYDGTNNRWDLQQGRDTNSNTTYAVFTAPTASAAGKAGLVPAPASNTMNYVLTASGWKNNASVAYATNAGKSTNDSAGQQINTTYIKNASVSGKTVTFTKGDGSTFSFQTQDTTYTIPTDYMSTATVSGKDITFTLKNGSTFKITTQDTNTTYANFGVPTGSVAGTAGLVPAPAKNTMNYILTASGWSNTASAAYATKAGTATRADTATYATNAGTATYAQNIPAQAYVSTATVSGKTITFTRGDGSTFSFQTQDNNTTYGAMTAATTSTDGAAGLVPKPTSSAYNYVLSGHGWVEKANKAATADYATNSGTATHANDAVTTASVSGKVVTFTKGNGDTFSITTQDTNTTYANMGNATSSTAGSAGLVPAPAKGYQDYFLTGSGWKTNTGTSAYATNSGTATHANDAVTTASVSGKVITLTKGNGGTFSITTQDTNTTYANFGAPTSSAAGSAGLVPAPASNTMNYILTASGWKNNAGTVAYATNSGTATHANDAVTTASVSGKDVTFTKGNNTTFKITTQDTDTKNTAGSTDTSSKIFLIGATSQAANPQTYSDNEVYTTNGVLTTKSVQVGGTSATMQYNSTNECIEFVFV